MHEHLWDNDELKNDPEYKMLDEFVRAQGWWMIEQLARFKSGTLEDEHLQKLDELNPMWVAEFTKWLVTTGWVSPKAFNNMIEPDS